MNEAERDSVKIGHPNLTLEQVQRVAHGAAQVTLDQQARHRVEAARRAVERALEQDSPKYGINTGFGALAEVKVPSAELATLQLNLVRSHACGIGAPYSRAITRAILLLRAQVLAMGHSGVRAELVELIIAMLNRGVHPVIPSKGSVGASGDLAPLAHLALVIVGEGQAELEGQVMGGMEALQLAGLQPMVLAPKEGLALINGTQAMTADGVLTLLAAERLCKAADVAAAMTIEALMGSHRPADSRIAALRPYQGHSRSAANLRVLLEGSELNRSHSDCSRVQDPYSCRCTPQVHGASRDAIAHVRSILEVEINSVTDNPLVFIDEEGTGEMEILSGGNFHGQPVAISMDLLTIAVAELANISDRRVDQLLNDRSNFGLPPFLGSNPGLESGFMIAQVAGASLVSENKVLAHPSSVDSITTSAGKEDHVSMGTFGAAKARTVLDNTTYVLAVEMAAAARGLDLRHPTLPGKGVRIVHRAIRELVPPMDGDRALHQDIEGLKRAIEGDLVHQLQESFTALQ